IAAASHLALGVLPSGDVRAVYFDPGAKTLFSKLRTASGWGAPSMIPGAFDPDSGIPDVGHVSQFIDVAGSAHVAFHIARLSGESEAHYSQFAGSNWTDPKTLEGIQFDGVAGYSIGLGVANEVRPALHFVLPRNATVADLRMATWSRAEDIPTLEVLSQGIASDTPP